MLELFLGDGEVALDHSCVGRARLVNVLCGINTLLRTDKSCSGCAFGGIPVHENTNDIVIIEGRTLLTFGELHDDVASGKIY